MLVDRQIVPAVDDQNAVGRVDADVREVVEVVRRDKRQGQRIFQLQLEFSSGLGLGLGGSCRG